MRSARIAVALAGVALVAIAAAAWMMRGEQTRRESVPSPVVDSITPVAPVIPEAPRAERRPVEATEPAPEAEEVPPEILALRARRTAKVRGRLVMKDGGPLPDEAIVSLWTGTHTVDYEESIAKRGETGVDPGLWRFRRGRPPGPQWRSSFEARARADGSFEIAVPPDLPRFRFQLEAAFALYPEKEAWYGLDDPRLEGLTLDLDPAGAVEGHVTSTGGRPLARAHVRLVGAGPGARTGEGGEFSLRAIPPGTYGAFIEVAGVGPSSRAGIEVRTREVTRLDVEIPLGAYLAGRVVDRFGNPVPKPRLNLNPEQPDGTVSTIVVRTVEAEEDGTFLLASMDPGRYRLFVNPADGRYGTAVPGIEISPGTAIDGMEIVLPAWHFVSGRVLDSWGSPTVGALVAARNDSRFGLRGGRSKNVCAETDADGRFRIEGLDDAPLALHVLMPGVCEIARDGIEPDTEGIEIVLPPATGIAGRVADEFTGRSVPRFRIESNWSERTAGGGSSAGTGPSGSFVSEDGSFEMLGLKEGTYDLFFQAKDHVPTPLPDVWVKTGEVLRGVEVRMSPRVTVRGFVWDADAERVVANAKVFHEQTVQVSKTFRRTMQIETRSGLDGGFELRAVPAGTIKVRASFPGLPGGESEPIEALAGQALENVQVTMRAKPAVAHAPTREGSRVTGRVLRGGEGVAWAKVYVRPRESQVAAAQTSWGVTAADGSFKIDWVTPGPAWLEVVVSSEAGQTTVPVAIDVPIGEVLSVDVQLPSGQIAGQVYRLSDRQPVVGASVMATGEGIPSGERRASAKTDEEGRFEIVGLSEGVYRVIASPERGRIGRNESASALGVGVREGVIVAEGSPNEVDLGLAEGTPLVVTVMDGASRPIPGATVRIRSKDWGHLDRADARGIVRREGLLPGTHEVRVEAQGFQEARRSIEIGPGRPEEIEIRLELQPR